MTVPLPSGAERAAYRACEAIARAHAENFPVASRLLPAGARSHLAAFYAFARRADDWADEPGRGGAEPRRAALAALRQRLHATPAAGESDPVFVALSASRRALALDFDLFERLLDAFERDLAQPRYDTWDDLLSYCRDSAEPVGRLVLRAVGDADEEHARLSDRICTALQLTNFWQDLSRDEPAGRAYLPRHERERWGDARALAYAIARTRRLFDDGAPLARLAPPPARAYLRAVLAGGRTILARVEALGARAFVERPALGARDRARIVLEALGGRSSTGSSFTGSFLLLPPARREALSALHSFCRALDDAVDDAPDLDLARAGHARAACEVEALAAGVPSTPAGLRLLSAWSSLGAGAHALRDEGLAELVSGLALDAHGFRPADDADLARYCRGVGGGPGLAALPVLGRADARAFAHELGIALQRTNVLRDTAADARAGRCYVPAEDLERAGLAACDLIGAHAPEGWRPLARALARRARTAFERAKCAVPRGAGRALAPALAMGRVYEELLARIEADPGRVFRERVHIAAWSGALHVLVTPWLGARALVGESARHARENAGDPRGPLSP